MVPRCNSGYKNVDMTGITMHTFREEWKGKIRHCGKWEITNNVGICSKHFMKEDIVFECMPSNDRGKRKKKGEQLAKPYFRDDAVPTIFPNCPKHLTTKRQPRSMASSSKRREKAKK